ncbi:hypothetical protein ABW20_dc0110395 [Dactylellina cionopaga]|nr:hypothetical protein ABW20_dc0110395 [Dactylellina cionopaga]
MSYGGAIPTFEAHQIPQTTADLDVFEHLEVLDQHLARTIEEESVSRPSKYSLALSNTNKNIPTAVRTFVTSIRSQSFKQTIDAFKDLHRHNFVQHLSGSDFSSIFMAANPKLLFPISWMARKITHGTLSEANPYTHVYKRFWSDLNFVLENMLVSGHQPTTLDYTTLMSKAMWTGNPELQESFWDRMVKSGVQPNTWTYNTRLAMIAGIRPSNNLRKFPLVHSQKYLSHWQSQEQNALTQAMTVYADMLKQKLFPNDMTVQLLILAHARVGDVPGISKIVRNVYGVVIDGDNEKAQQIITRGSPVYPTSKTLKSLVVAYCRNSQFGAALQAVEHLARIYGLNIEEKIWDVLLTYSYAFSRPKYGLVPQDTTARLAEMMVGRTGNNEPSLQARDIIIRSLTRSPDPEDLVAAEKQIRKAVSYFRFQIQHKYMLKRDRWTHAPPVKSEIWKLEKAMNEDLYAICMWKDAIGYWLYALVRAYWDKMVLEETPMAEFETFQRNIMEEFGAYWQNHRPIYEAPKEAGEKKVVPERVMFRYKYPTAMAGLKGFPAM